MEHFAHNLFGWFEPGDMQFYKEMVENAQNGAHFVEVGSFKGRSSAYMTVEIINSGKNIKFDCVDTWLGSDVHNEGGYAEDADCVAGRLYEVFLENMKPVEGHYTAIRMPSVNAAKLYEDESLDFVFIDADHEYEAVHADISAWLPKIKKGGLIAGHDFTFSGVAQAVHELLPIEKVVTFSGPLCWKYTKE